MQYAGNGLGDMYNVVAWVCTSSQCALWQASHTTCLGTRLAVKIDLSGDYGRLYCNFRCWFMLGYSVLLSIVLSVFAINEDKIAF